MVYHSTRNSALSVSASDAITQGIAPDGGLFVPEEIPKLSQADFSALGGLSYAERAARILGLYLTDFEPEELRQCTRDAYETGHFDTPNVQEIVTLPDGISLLELWHGPTCAFKDMALQILPGLLTRAARKTGFDGEIVILTATSGDTGKAALAGFRDAPNTRILVFYPEDGVSEMQKRQMRTQEGENVDVCAVRGNFDDCQNGVKAIFTDSAMRGKLQRAGMRFSSANSINWGRLVPQIVYYVSAYVTMLEKGILKPGEAFRVTVPTGNFGNILAAWYAKRMGVPIRRLYCASNINHVLTDFLRTGVYDRNRAFHPTISPSMDILISSNLERLLWHMTDGDSERVGGLFAELARNGKYEIPKETLQRIQEEFSGAYYTDEETKRTIGAVFDECGYLSDTHTAVGLCAARDNSAGEAMLVASTASPFKFSPAVLEALGEETAQTDEYELLNRLSQRAKRAVPQPLAALRTKPVRFQTVIDAADMARHVEETLGLA